MQQICNKWQIAQSLTLFLNSILLIITVFPLLRYIQIYAMLKIRAFGTERRALSNNSDVSSGILAKPDPIVVAVSYIFLWNRMPLRGSGTHQWAWIIELRDRLITGDLMLLCLVQVTAYLSQLSKDTRNQTFKSHVLAPSVSNPLLGVRYCHVWSRPSANLQSPFPRTLSNPSRLSTNTHPLELSGVLLRLLSSLLDGFLPVLSMQRLIDLVFVVSLQPRGWWIWRHRGRRRRVLQDNDNARNLRNSTKPTLSVVFDGLRSISVIELNQLVWGQRILQSGGPRASKPRLECWSAILTELASW